MEGFDLFDLESHKEELKDARLKEQEDNSDFAYLENGEIEKCDNCHSFINSHGHCPLCDYLCTLD